MAEYDYAVWHVLPKYCVRTPGRYILIMCDIHRPLWLVSVHGELKWLSGGTLLQAGLLSRATASNSCRKNIGLSKLSPDSTLHRKVAKRRGILSFFLLFHVKIVESICFEYDHILKAIFHYHLNSLYTRLVLIMLDLLSLLNNLKFYDTICERFF
jgi:hypothetical protein